MSDLDGTPDVTEPGSMDFEGNMTLFNDSQMCRNTESYLTVPVQIAVIIAYSFASLASIFGNVMVVFVLAYGPRAKADVNTFLINLAVCDILMGIFCIPFSFVDGIYLRWIFGPIMCPLVKFVQVVSVSGSVFTLSALGWDRYCAVYRPIQSHTRHSRFKLSLVFVWIAAIAIGSVQLIVTRMQKCSICVETYSTDRELNRTLRITYTVVVFFATYFIPLCIMMFTYLSIAHKLWGHRTPGNANETRDQQQTRSKKKVTLMVMIIVVLFAICWLPTHVFSQMETFKQGQFFDRNDSYVMMTLVFLGVNWLAMANSFVNPIIYSFLNENFKADLKTVFGFMKSRNASRKENRKISTSSYTYLRPTSLRTMRRTGTVKTADGDDAAAGINDGDTAVDGTPRGSPTRSQRKNQKVNADSAV